MFLYSIFSHNIFVIRQVGGDMGLEEASHLIRAADRQYNLCSSGIKYNVLFSYRNGDRGVDYSEFPELWQSLHEGDNTVGMLLLQFKWKK